MNIASYIDHTILKPTTITADIEKLCSEAVEYGFVAVCVPPPYVKRTATILQAVDIQVATVVGFPMGYNAIEAKVAETVLAIVDGAHEIDMVANIVAIKNGDWDYLAKEIHPVADIVQQRGKVLKLILETGELSREEMIKCCALYQKFPVQYIKTSTGYARQGASAETVALLREHLPATIKIKASGGIKDYATACKMIAAGASRIGTSSGIAIVNGGSPELN